MPFKEFFERESSHWKALSSEQLLISCHEIVDSSNGRCFLICLSNLVSRVKLAFGLLQLQTKSFSTSSKAHLRSYLLQLNKKSQKSMKLSKNKQEFHWNVTGWIFRIISQIGRPFNWFPLLSWKQQKAPDRVVLFTIGNLLSCVGRLLSHILWWHSRWYKHDYWQQLILC